MKAISKEPEPYVCEMDRALEKKERTVFYIRPKTYKEVNASMKRYGRSVSDDAQGKKDYDVDRLNDADQKEWCDVVAKIENFCFDKKFYDKHENMKAKADKNGYIAIIESDVEKIMVLENLPAGIVGEIWKASQDATYLKAGQKNV